jgi:hypothetical protein
MALTRLSPDCFEHLVGAATRLPTVVDSAGDKVDLGSRATAALVGVGISGPLGAIALLGVLPEPLAQQFCGEQRRDATPSRGKAPRC